MADRAVVEKAAKALVELSESIEQGWSGDQTFAEAWGWNVPPIDRYDLRNIFSELGDKVRRLDDTKLSETMETILGEVPDRVEYLKSNSVVHLYDGNAVGAVPVFLNYASSLSWFVDQKLPASVDWTSVETQKQMPMSLLRRLRGVNTQIGNLETEASSLSGKVDAINNAHAAAEQLPTDLEELQRSKTVAAKAEGDAKKALEGLNAQKKEIETLLGKIRASQKEADALVSKCGEAFSAVTTYGLGGAFDLRARRLAISMWVWSLFLAGALVVGGWISHERIQSVQSAISANASSAQLIVSAILALVSIAAPVWFAWVATKQIGQRFRLAEDYAFKASIAKAYEGYRREAIKTDPKLAGKLFNSALDRLDEAPLRYVEQDTHGSPLHELAAGSTRAGGLLANLKKGKSGSARQRGGGSENRSEETDEG